MYLFCALVLKLSVWWTLKPLNSVETYKFNYFKTFRFQRSILIIILLPQLNAYIWFQFVLLFTKAKSSIHHKSYMHLIDP